MNFWDVENFDMFVFVVRPKGVIFAIRPKGGFFVVGSFVIFCGILMSVPVENSCFWSESRIVLFVELSDRVHYCVIARRTFIAKICHAMSNDFFLRSTLLAS